MWNDSAAGTATRRTCPRVSTGPFSIEPGAPGACTVAASVVAPICLGAWIDTRNPGLFGSALTKLLPVPSKGVSDCRCHSADFAAASVTASDTVKTDPPSQVKVRLKVFTPAEAG